MIKLYRYPKKAFLRGVCYGIGVRSKIFFGFAIIYIILWIFVPKYSDDSIKL